MQGEIGEGEWEWENIHLGSNGLVGGGSKSEMGGRASTMLLS